ncbi:MAG: hypothetical protein Q4F69_12475, partial [Bacteroidia bacterium]|nr:hypothetical protein [Bacteroidia bacterium]
AGAMIDSLDATSLEGEDAALYAILKTQADWKRYDPLTSDSLPRLATDYYGTPYRKNYHAAMAWYSLGCTFLDKRLDLEAIEAFLKAKSLFPDTLSRYYALCEQQLGKLYLLHHLYSQSLEEFTAYTHTVTQLCDTALMQMADYFTAYAMMPLKKFEEAKQLFLPLSSTTPPLFVYQNDVLLQLAKIEYYMGEAEASEDLLNSHISGSQKNKNLGTTFLFKGNIFYDAQQYDSAHLYYLRALDYNNDLNTRCELNKMLASTSGYVNDSVAASIYAHEYAVLLDSIYRQSNKSEISSIQTKHTLWQLAQEQKMKRQRFVFLTLFGAVLLLSIGVVALQIYHRRKEKRYIVYSEKMRESICEQIALQVETEVLEEPINENTEEVCLDKAAIEPSTCPKVQETFDRQVYDLREERIQYCREQFSKSEWSSYLNKKKEAIANEEYMKTSDRVVFRNYVSKLFAEITLELVRDSKKMNAEYVFICQLCMLGFSGKAIGHCICAVPHAVYCRKSRIKDRLTAEWNAHVFSSPEEKYGL